MIHETPRLILRPWELADAESLFKYAKDPLVGPVAGWSVHTSVENSRKTIKYVLSAPETYAVCLKPDGEAIGSISLLIGKKCNIEVKDTEAEIGFWLGVPFWGRGLIPEAVFCLEEYAFETLNLSKLWCGYFDGNENSKRVQEKCGFKYVKTLKDVPWPLMNDIRTEHISSLTKEEWSRNSYIK